MNIDLTKLETLGPLKSGSHSGPAAGACVMEAAAYVAGEPWSDQPQCVCWIIGMFLRNWNDDLLNDAERDRFLRPLIPKIIGTRADKATEQRRSYMALDWLIRTHLPAWLRAARLHAHADNVAGLDPIVDIATAVDAAPVVRAAGDAAEAAAGDAAGAAAWDAARAAARAAAGAARAAVGAAAEDAWAVAGDAVEAACDAAKAVAGSALIETRDQLQLSAVELVERMAALADPT